MVSQEGHLLHTDSILVKGTIDRFSHTERHGDREQRRQEVVDRLRRLQHNNRQRIGQATVGCEHGRRPDDDVGLASNAVNVDAEAVD